MLDKVNVVRYNTTILIKGERYYEFTTNTF